MLGPRGGQRPHYVVNRALCLTSDHSADDTEPGSQYNSHQNVLRIATKQHIYFYLVLLVWYYDNIKTMITLLHNFIK